jgi:hypothetical protein
MIYKLLYLFFRIIRGLANRVVKKEIIQPREYSNEVIKRYGSFFCGDVINVSGWNDSDWEGGKYEDYFSNKKSYTVSNAKGYYRGYGSMEGKGVEEVELDLEKPLKQDLVGKYDLVFNHTTLEHVFDLEMAVKNICDLSRDSVIIVVPGIQNVHITRTYGDYWRLTPLCLFRIVRKYGFEPIVLKCNDNPFAPIYITVIATKKPEKYLDKFEKNLDFEMGAYSFGSSLKKDALKILVEK